MKKRLLTVLAILTGMLLLSASIVWAQPAPVAKTGQTISYVTGDDGDLQKGVASPSPRFTDHGDGTVTDNLTGLMWAKDADMAGGLLGWYQAINYVDNLTLGISCGGEYTDWRLPNVRELQSLIDFGHYDPALPTGHPFTSVQSDYYWSSTVVTFMEGAWYVSMKVGYAYFYYDVSTPHYVWPVRGGN